MTTFIEGADFTPHPVEFATKIAQPVEDTQAGEAVMLMTQFEAARQSAEAFTLAKEATRMSLLAPEAAAQLEADPITTVRRQTAEGLAALALAGSAVPNPAHTEARFRLNQAALEATHPNGSVLRAVSALVRGAVRIGEASTEGTAVPGRNQVTWRNVAAIGSAIASRALPTAHAKSWGIKKATEATNYR